MCVARAIITLGLFFILIGVLFFVITCTEHLPEFVFSADFKKANCTVTSGGYIGDTCCDVKPSESCKQTYPCVAVNVTCIIEGEEKNGIIFKNYDNFHYQPKGNSLKCSYFECESDYDEAMAKANEYVDRFDLGQADFLYHDTSNPENVFTSRMSDGAIAGWFVWSIIAFIVGCALTIFGCNSDDHALCGSNTDADSAKEMEQHSDDDLVEIIEPHDAIKYQYDNEVMEDDTRIVISRPPTAVTCGTRSPTGTTVGTSGRPQTAATVLTNELVLPDDVLNVPGQSEEEV